jgi:hypothetical protein
MKGKNKLKLLNLTKIWILYVNLKGKTKNSVKVGEFFKHF